MRKIYCAHFWSVKMLTWPWFREINVCIEAKIENLWNLHWSWFREISTCWIFATHSYIPESGLRKYFQHSGMWAIDFPHEITPRNMILREISKIFDFRFNTHIYSPESGSRKHFHVLGMRANDFSHKITPRKPVFRQKIWKFSTKWPLCTI